MEDDEIRHLDSLASTQEAWPGRYLKRLPDLLVGLGDPPAPPQWGTDNLLDGPLFAFKARLEDDPFGGKVYSRQVASVPGIVIPTLLPVDPSMWTTMKVNCCAIPVDLIISVII